MSEEELININGIREDLYQAMQIGDITVNSKHSQELYDFMNYQDKEIERLNNIINEIEKELDLNLPFKVIGVRRLKNKIKELKGRDSNE